MPSNWIQRPVTVSSSSPSGWFSSRPKGYIGSPKEDSIPFPVCLATWDCARLLLSHVSCADHGLNWIVKHVQYILYTQSLRNDPTFTFRWQLLLWGWTIRHRVLPVSASGICAARRSAHVIKQRCVGGPAGRLRIGMRTDHTGIHFWCWRSSADVD